MVYRVWLVLGNFEGFEIASSSTAMDSLTKVLHIVFAEHFIGLVFFSVSWLLIYGTVSFSDLVARKVLLRIPFYLWIQLSRRRMGLPDWRSAIGSSALTLATMPPTSAVEIGRLYGSVDDKISRIRSGRHWVGRILSDESIYTEIENIRNNEWTLLESDCALSEAASLDPKTIEVGLLSSIGNKDIPQNEVLGVLFHSLKVGPPSVKKIALFHMPPKITSPAQLEMLESILDALPASLDQIADKTVTEIRNHLSIKGPIRTRVS